MQRIPAKVLQVIESRSWNHAGIARYYNNLKMTNAKPCGHFEAALKLDDPNDSKSPGFLTTLVDGVSTFSVLIKKQDPKKFGVSVVLDVSPTIYGQTNAVQELHFVSKVVKDDGLLVELDCEVYDQKKNLVCHGTHIKFVA